VIPPVRPNGTTGWIPANEGRSAHRIEVDLDRYRLELVERCDRFATSRIGVGTLDTPTPHGTFFLNALLKPPHDGTVYGALAFGPSAYSEVVTDRKGSIVGPHRTNDPSSLGGKVSHGCIRFDNRAIRQIAWRPSGPSSRSPETTKDSFGPERP